MMRGAIQSGLILLALFAAGCGDFLQQRFGGVRTQTDERAPKPGPALAITNPPAPNKPPIVDSGLRPAAFVPLRDPAASSDAPLLQHPMRVIYQRAAQRYASMDSYIYRFTRREGGPKKPTEVILVKLRREPFSVSLKWLGDEGKGRETIYVQGKYDNKMQILLAADDLFPFSPAGKRLAFAPDDPLVKAKSRHPITSTGFGSVIERYGWMVSAIERGDPRAGTAKHLGRVQRKEFPEKVEAIHQVLPPKASPEMPQGGEVYWYFDIASGLPVLVITHDATGEIAYYCHDYIQAPVRLDDDDFDPDRLWRK